MHTLKHIAVAVASVTLLAVAPACDSASDDMEVDTRGATLVSDDGRFVLEIPDGALEDAVDVSLASVPCERPDALACYSLQPMGVAFLEPARVTFELGGLELGETDPQDIGIVAQRGAQWQMLADREVSEENEIVTASAMFLSDFAIGPVDPVLVGY